MKSDRLGYVRKVCNIGNGLFAGQNVGRRAFAGNRSIVTKSPHQDHAGNGAGGLTGGSSGKISRGLNRSVTAVEERWKALAATLGTG